MHRIFPVMLSAALFIVGCSAAAPASRQQEAAIESLQQLEGVRWRLVSFGMTRMAVPQDAYLVLREGRYSGRGGCNQIAGSYAVTEGSIAFKEGMSTMMACPEMELESMFMECLGRVDAYRINGDALDLRAEGKSLLRFKAQ